MQSWELIVLLLSKCAMNSPNTRGVEDSTGVLRSQRILSQVTEMIRTAHFGKDNNPDLIFNISNPLLSFKTVHCGMINFQSLNELGKGLQTDDELMLGNKLSLLSGDYLLGTASAQIAALR